MLSNVLCSHVVFNTGGSQCACACPAATTHPAHAEKSHTVRGTAYRRDWLFSVRLMLTPVRVYLHASPGAGPRLCCRSAALTRQVCGLGASDVGGGLGGNNNNRARCCPVSIATSSGPCCLTLTTPVHASRPVQSSPAQSSPETRRDGRGGPPAAGGLRGEEPARPAPRAAGR